MAKKSKRSKAADQKRLSVPEILADKNLHISLKADVRALAYEIKRTFDARGKGWARLKFMADAKDLTPVQYFCKFIAPKL